MTAAEALASGALTLLPERAVFSPRERTLFVADLHLGKAAAFRAAGAPAPFGASEETLRRLGALVDCARGRAARRPRRLRPWRASSVTDGLAESLRAWRRARRALDCLIVLGNHDRRAAHLYARLRLPRRSTEPALVAGIACRHHPLDGEARGRPSRSPATFIRSRGSAAAGRDSLRLPCFVIDGRQIVLPAFGEFTGGGLVRPDEGQRIVLVAPDRLIELPRPTPSSAA